MRLLFYSGTSPIGGHLRSALTIAEELVSRGHELCFVAPNGPGVELIKKSRVEYFILPHPPTKSQDFNWRNFFQLKEIVENFRPEILHSFLKGIPQLALLKQRDMKFLYTICGGKPHRYFPLISPVVVFSEELKNWLLKIGLSESEIFVIPGRMQIGLPTYDDSLSKFRSVIGLDGTEYPVVMMICRTDITKEKAIRSFFRAAEIFGRSNKKGVFVHIGSGNEEMFQTKIRNMALSINANVGRNVLISTDYGSSDPVKFLHFADIGVGMGRSAFECMVMCKPTFILSNEGFGGSVSPKNINDLACYNFTARYNKNNSNNIDDNAKELVSEIKNLLNSELKLKEIAIFGKKYYENHLDVRKAAELYEDIYSSIEINYKPPTKQIIAKSIITEIVRSTCYVFKSQK